VTSVDDLRSSSTFLVEDSKDRAIYCGTKTECETYVSASTGHKDQLKIIPGSTRIPKVSYKKNFTNKSATIYAHPKAKTKAVTKPKQNVKDENGTLEDSLELLGRAMDACNNNVEGRHQAIYLASSLFSAAKIAEHYEVCVDGWICDSPHYKEEFTSKLVHRKSKVFLDKKHVSVLDIAEQLEESLTAQLNLDNPSLGEWTVLCEAVSEIVDNLIRLLLLDSSKKKEMEIDMRSLLEDLVDEDLLEEEYGINAISSLPTKEATLYQDGYQLIDWDNI
jgi:hypothetical protein